MPTMTTQPVQFRTIDGVRVRYADTEGLRKQTIVLTSPWPESLYAFTPMWATLSEHARLFAVDLPGFGASERLFASLTVGAGGIKVPIQLGEPLASWVLDPDIGKYRTMDPRATVSDTVSATAT